MPHINPKVQLNPVPEERKAVTSCSPVPGKAVENMTPNVQSDKSGKLEQSLKDSSKIQSGAQGKAQTQLNLDGDHKELKLESVQGELQKLKQGVNQLDSTQTANLKQALAKQQTLMDEIEQKRAALDQTAELDSLAKELSHGEKPAKPDPVLEKIKQIKDPKVQQQALKQHMEQLIKELEPSPELPMIQELK